MLEEYDIVKAIKPLNDLVPEGTLGSVLIVFDSNPIEYEVEFVNKAGESIAVLTVSQNDLVKQIC